MIYNSFQITEDVEEEKNRKRKFSNIKEPDELNFLLKSGTVLCKLISKIYPECGIDVDRLEVSFCSYTQVLPPCCVYRQGISTPRRRIFHNSSRPLWLMASQRSISLSRTTLLLSHTFTSRINKCLQVQVYHIIRVTRAIFALAERVQMDPTFEGEYLQYVSNSNQQV